jgi:hypothetical protein
MNIHGGLVINGHKMLYQNLLNVEIKKIRYIVPFIVFINKSTLCSHPIQIHDQLTRFKGQIVLQLNFQNIVGSHIRGGKFLIYYFFYVDKK